MCKHGRLCGLVVAFLFAFGFCGCSVVDYIIPEKPPLNEEIYAGYDQTILKVSNSADVLAAIHKPEYEVLSQSTNVIASWGQKKKGYKSWFNMVAFDETAPTALRKYFFVADDRPNVLEEPKKSVIFDCEAVIGRDVLDEPYVNNNARLIAILKDILKKLREDTGQVGSDNAELGASGMFAAQCIYAALVELGTSPVLASKLSEDDGMNFGHINLGKGRIQLIVVGDFAKVKMRLGSPAKKRNWGKSLKPVPEAEEGGE